MQFYRKLSTLRKEAGLSQEQLAEKAGVSRQTIFKWESGLASPSMENILTLSRLFCVSADELIGNEAFAARESEESLRKEDGRTPQNTSDQEDERSAFTAEQGGGKKQVVNTLPPSFFLVFIMNTRASGPCSDFRSSIFMWERASIMRRESLR